MLCISFPGLAQDARFGSELDEGRADFALDFTGSHYR